MKIISPLHELIVWEHGSTFKAFSTRHAIFVLTISTYTRDQTALYSRGQPLEINVEHCQKRRCL